MNHISKSKIREFHRQIKSHNDVIDFTLGDPKEEINDEIKKATTDSINQGNTHYSTNRGELSLIKEISKKEIFYSEEEIYITSGATQGIFEVIMTLLNRKDGVLVGIPTYPSYISLIQLFDLELQCFNFDDEYQIQEHDLRNKITNQTKAIIITHPHNPTGTILNKKTIAILHKIILEFHLYLIWDATYYENDFLTLYHPSIHNYLIQVHSFSKNYQMSGYRIGYNCGLKENIDKMLILHQFSQSCISPFIQHAAEVALNTIQTNYQLQKKYVINQLLEMKIDVLENEGPFYVYFSIKPFNMNSETFAYRLLEEGVAVLPGKYFYEEGYIRMSICISLEKCKEGCERMKRFIQRL